MNKNNKYHIGMLLASVYFITLSCDPKPIRVCMKTHQAHNFKNVIAYRNFYLNFNFFLWFGGFKILYFDHTIFNFK